MVSWLKNSLVVLLLLPSLGNAANRTLTGDCTSLPAVESPPTQGAPYDLDGCTILEGDDVTGIFTGAQTRWGSVALRAPSKSVGVTSDTVAFTVDNFYFYEDQSARNKLTVTHAPSSPTGSITLLYSCVPCDTVLAYCPLGAAPEAGGAGNWDKPQRTTVMWSFTNYDNVLIGGSNLSVTLTGTHPGLGNAGDRRCGTKPSYPTNEQNVGLVDLRVNDSSNPTLVDIRANTRNVEVYSVYFMGAQAVNGTTGRAQQVNIAGSHWNTGGVFANGGVKNIWFDPDRTVISDPYARGYGWVGTSTGTLNGRNIGCYDVTRSANGRGHNSGPFFTDSITGGITFEYGYLTFTPNAPIKNVGSAGNPFIVRLKDWGSSGPGTGYPAGVSVKKSSDSIFFKGDPHPTYGNSSPFRFIRFVSLPSTYGQGIHGESLAGCGGADAVSNLIRFEANDNDGITFGWDATFTGNWDTQAQGGNWIRGDLVLTAYDPWSATDRSYGHVIRAASDTTFKDMIKLVDTNTATGPGFYSNISVAGLVSFHDPGYTQAAQANTITQTNVSGAITVAASTGTTTISHVNFSGASRAVITIGDGAAVVASYLCVPSGSTITKSGTTGTLTYNGVSQTLPYTISPTTGCVIPADGRPNPASGGSVN